MRPLLPGARCALTAPFHPYLLPALLAQKEAVSSLLHWPSVCLEANIPDVIRHTALRSSDFPPPANALPVSRQKRTKPAAIIQPPAHTVYLVQKATQPRPHRKAQMEPCLHRHRTQVQSVPFCVLCVKPSFHPARSHGTQRSVQTRARLPLGQQAPLRAYPARRRHRRRVRHRRRHPRQRRQPLRPDQVLLLRRRHLHHHPRPLFLHQSRRLPEVRQTQKHPLLRL